MQPGLEPRLGNLARERRRNSFAIFSVSFFNESAHLFERMETASRNKNPDRVHAIDLLRCRSMIEQERRTIDQRPRQVLCPYEPNVERRGRVGGGLTQAGEFGVHALHVRGDRLLLLGRSLVGGNR